MYGNSFHKAILRQRFIIGKEGSFQLSSDATYLHLKRCTDVTLKDIKEITNLTIANSRKITVSIEMANPRLEVSVR